MSKLCSCVECVRDEEPEEIHGSALTKDLGVSCGVKELEAKLDAEKLMVDVLRRQYDSSRFEIDQLRAKVKELEAELANERELSKKLYEALKELVFTHDDAVEAIALYEGSERGNFKMAPTTLGNIVKEVLETGNARALDARERKQFYQDFYQEVSNKIEEVRNDQRRAYEDGKNLILAWGHSARKD